MNKKKMLFLLPVVALTSCAKTKLLYKENAYNSPIFDENYYLEWEGVDKLNIRNNASGVITATYSDYRNTTENVFVNGKDSGYKWDGTYSEQFGYNNNLSKIEKKFNYGVTSKLFDGRVRCEGYYQKSRVQLDKSGFAMFFPKALKDVKYLGFACRGGSDYPDGQGFSYSDMKINVEWSFYIHVDSSSYDKVTYKLRNIEIPVDNGGNTTFVQFPGYYNIMTGLSELYDATAMSFKWEFNDYEKIEDEKHKKCSIPPTEEVINADMLLPDDEAQYFLKVDHEYVRPTSYDPLAEYYKLTTSVHEDMTDDYTQKEKHHLSLMLYEVFIGDSIWG